MIKFTTHQANELYNILVETCEAQEHWRQSFIQAMQEGCREYRIGGSLGFGGKLRNNNGIYVDCYPEDLTPERQAIIAKANHQLKLKGCLMRQ